jgi:hypothetical protein
MADMFQAARKGLESPADIIRPVIPDDDEDLPEGLTRALFVGVAGDVVCVDKTGQEFTLTSGAAQYHPLRVARIKATSTDALGILALY